MFGDYRPRETPFEYACRALRGGYWTRDQAEELARLVQMGTRPDKRP